MQGTEGRLVRPDQRESNNGGSVGRAGWTQLREPGKRVRRHYQEKFQVLKGQTFRVMVAEKQNGNQRWTGGDSGEEGMQVHKLLGFQRLLWKNLIDHEE